MPSTFVILGAIGDLTSRYLMPALGELADRRELSDDLRVVGVARHDLDDAEFRERLRADAPGEVGPGFAAVLDRTSYIEGDATDPDLLDQLCRDEGDDPVLVYLALPPAVFDDSIAAIAKTRWADRVRLGIEKPFGEDLDGARHLNEVLHQHLRPEQVYRIDHFLHQTLSRRLPALRRSALLSSLWASGDIENLDLVWDETIALEGRAGYYDDTGALVDMVQNHLLQLLAVLTMDLPDDDDPGSLAAARHEVLRRLEADPARSVRARYTAGTIDGSSVPAYVDEDGVEASRETETFTSVPLLIDDSRWRHTAVRLRTGKALDADRRFVRVGLRGGDEVVFGIDPLTLGLTVDGAGLAAPVATDRPSPYAGVVREMLAGERAWFVSGPEAEEQWRVVTPVLEAWGSGRPELAEYRAGSAGPEVDAGV